MIANHKAIALAMRWLVKSAKERKDIGGFPVKVQNELNDILNNKGGSMKKREELHNTAAQNRPFLKFLK